MLSIEAARLAARQKDSAGVARDLLSVPEVKIRGQPVRGPGDRGPGVGFPSLELDVRNDTFLCNWVPTVLV